MQEAAGLAVHVTLRQPGKFSAMWGAIWRALWAVFDRWR